MLLLLGKANSEDTPQLSVEIGSRYFYISSSNLAQYIFDTKLEETVKAGIPKKISYVICLFINSDGNSKSIGNLEISQEISYDVWEEEFQVKYWNNRTENFTYEEKAFNTVSTLNAVRFLKPESLTSGTVFWFVMSVNIEPFSQSEKKEFQSWISPERGKGISLQDFLDYFLKRGIKTTKKQFIIKSPFYKME